MLIINCQHFLVWTWLHLAHNLNCIFIPKEMEGNVPCTISFSLTPLCGNLKTPCFRPAHGAAIAPHGQSVAAAQLLLKQHLRRKVGLAQPCDSSLRVGLAVQAGVGSWACTQISLFTGVSTHDLSFTCHRGGHRWGGEGEGISFMSLKPQPQKLHDITFVHFQWSN